MGLAVVSRDYINVFLFGIISYYWRVILKVLILIIWHPGR